MTIRVRLSLRALLALSLMGLAGAAPDLAPATAAAATAAPAAGPVTFTVNNVNDVVADFSNDPNFTVCHTGPNNNICTLRAAVMNADEHLGGATIQLPAGTYVLQLPPDIDNGPDTGDLDLTNNITLNGAGPASTIVDGGGLDGVFDIYFTNVVTMTGVTIRNGRSNNNEGGLRVDAQLNLSNSVVTNNFYEDGGSGLYVTGKATLDRVTVSNNEGGGIYNQGALTITNSSLYDNDGGDSGGGAIFNEGGVLKVFNSTLSNNQSVFDGGAINNDASATILASTIAGNLADSEVIGGGTTGGGIYNTGTLLLGDTLLADNFVSHTVNECAGNAITSQDYNDLDVITGCTLVGTTTDNVVPGQNLFLGPLADNGGPTLTRALFPGNPAVDQIPPANCRDLLGAAPVPDQRGVARPIGPKCDIGALEGAPALPAYFRNLVVNGDAESSPGAFTGAWVGAPDWTVKDGQFTVVPYNAPGFPSVPTDTVPAVRGLNFFAGGRAADSLASQVVALPPELQASIDGGAVTYLLSADLGGFGNQADNAELQYRFIDGSHTPIGSLLFLGPVTAAERGNETGFQHLNATGIVPAHAVSLDLGIAMTRIFSGGSYNDGYADNISLVLLPKDRLFLPEMVR